MPRSIQAFTQNATVTNSPQNVSVGDPTQAIEDGASVFAPPSLLDICTGATNGTQNPFVGGLNDMGSGTNTSGVAGRTGNILSGLQIFSDSMCGLGLGGTVGSVLDAYRNLKAQGHTVESLRKLRDTVGTGTTPQSVIGGVEAVTGVVNATPTAQSAIRTGQQFAGISGNQVIDAVNGAQATANQAHQTVTGSSSGNVSNDDLLAAGSNALNQNTSNHVSSTSLTSAQSVSLLNQNLLVAEDFSSSSSVTADPKGNWSWDGSDGDPATNTLGCLKCTVNGSQDPYLSNEIPVAPGENIEVACTVRWDFLTYTGASPIILGVQKYRLMKDANGNSVYTDIGGYDVATVTSPGTDSAGAWVGIAGIYTVEPGVDQIRLRPEVAPNATGGEVKFDNCDFLKTDLIADEAVPGVGNTVDNIVTQLYGADGSGFTQNDAAIALANTASSLASVSSKIAALDSEGGTGAVAGDDFSWTGNILSNVNWGGSFSSTAHGGYRSNGTDCAWVTAGSFAAVSCLFNWLGTDNVSTTDYQLIQTTLDSSIGFDSRFPTSGASLYLLGRISSDFNNAILFQLRGDGAWWVYCRVSGTATVLDSGTTTAGAGTGTTVSLYCGDKPTSNPRHFRALVGTTTVCDFDEVGTTSQYGSSCREWGWGGQLSAWTGGYVGATYVAGEWFVPPKINQWLAQDQ